ncbi:LysR family transcriptional regulator [Vibrio salinus]|uniref:LysR family transcriptional regulator n=1 Tax=Vibrio salinus TaxID=2899784 RepID=UPI001E3C88E7|nr:LysR family transcriptional regulator [Vibrio salinus]MCE0493698.1 LysR family transcriptional regulator [Vibrio salinus]
MKQMKALLAQLTDADLRLLRVFIAVVECGGLSAAEMELNIGRSTISRHLKDLELRLGLVLCLRGRAGFSMTAEGRYIYDAAKRLIKSLEEFRNQVNDLHHTLKGRLIIAMFDKTITNDECRVNEAIARYIDEAPDVLIDIHVVPVNQIEKGVLEGEYHVGIIPPNRRSASLHYMPLFGEQMFLYCGRHHPFYGRAKPVSDTEIIAQRYAGLSFSSPNMGKGQALGFQKTAEASDQEGIATLISSGRYIGFLPDHFANSLVKNGMLSKIDNSSFSYNCQFTAIYRKSPQPPLLVQLFLNALEATARK